jgi:hypothetical protein
MATAGKPTRGNRHKVVLRDERRQDGSWLNLWAYLDEEGSLRIDGQDLGPVTAPVSSDGEYEYFKTVKAGDLPRLVALLGGRPDEDVLELLARSWTGARSYDLEDRLRASELEVDLHVWS